MSQCRTCSEPAAVVAYMGDVPISFCLDCARKPSCQFRGYIATTGLLPLNKQLLTKARQRGWMQGWRQWAPKRPVAEAVAPEAAP